MNTCKTCRWWGQDTKDYDHDPTRRLKTCTSPRLMRGYHISDNDVPDDCAHLEDDEGWGIFTGPDFGCIGHEPKPSEDPASHEEDS